MAKQEIAKQQDVPAFLKGFKPKHDVAVADSQGGGSYLPYIKLMSKTSPAVETHDAKPNSWYLVEGENLVELGKQVDVLPVTWRPLALDYGTKVSSHDPESELYKRIKAEADRPGQSSCLYGNQYLIWLADKQKWVIFFACSKSARRESHVITAALGVPSTLTSRTAKNDKGTWAIPTLIACNSKLSSLPEEKDALEQIEKFENPPQLEDKELATGSSRD